MLRRPIQSPQLLHIEPMTNARLVIDAISKAYGSVKALSELSFSMDSGGILAIVGENGAGKTTLLQILSGMITPTSGRVLIDGDDMSLSPLSTKKTVGFVPDRQQFFAGLTVWEHLSFTASTYRVSDFENLANGLLRDFGLDDKKHELTDSLSLGMRQKLSVICCYLYDPALLLFDEPFSGLDQKGIATLTDSIRQRAAQGCVVVISSHMLGLVEKLATRVLFMQRGVGRIMKADSLTIEDGGHPVQQMSLEQMLLAGTDKNA